MLSKPWCAFLLCLAFFSGPAQERIALKGKVVVGNAGLKDVFVINKSTDDETKTDGSGYFDIAAASGDALAVYSTKIIVREFTLNAASFENVPYIISVNYKPYELDEIVIDKNREITSESLGIVPKGQKKFTPAEKKLYTSSYNTPLAVLALGLLAGSMPVDPFINAISGRTKMLKKAVQAEKKGMAIAKVNEVYTDEQIESQLKIPAEYVRGFVFYAAEDKEVAQAIQAGDDGHIKILLAVLATKYNQLLADE